jgi:hypothetical protein
VNTSRIFAIEFFIAVGINSWGALKQGDVPWPPTIVMSALAMALTSMASIIDDRLAVLLGAGFLLAILVNAAQGGGGKIGDTFGAVPPSDTWDVLSFGGGAAPTGNTSGGTSNG